MDLKAKIDRYREILSHARKMYADNKDANLSKTEFVSSQLKHQAIGKIEILPKIIDDLKEIHEFITKLSEGKPETLKSGNCNLADVSGVLPSDSEMLDFIQELMTNDDSYCEVYLAGLRNWTGKATAYQFETNPEHISTLNAPTLREAITEAMKQKGNYR